MPILLLLGWLAAAPDLRQARPAGALVIETADVTRVAGKRRALVLWMLEPKRVARQPDAPYCGDDVYGDYYAGPARLSLADPAAPRLVNTVAIRAPEAEEDEFQVPFLVSGAYYRVPRPNAKHEGRPWILRLTDLTGEGPEAGFVLFDYAACGIANTSVFGYDPKSDRAVEYSVEVREDGKPPVTRLWVPEVFARQPVRPGVWDVTWDPGHGANADIHERVSFDSARQVFVNRRTITPQP
jgi:hypothetical protein